MSYKITIATARKYLLGIWSCFFLVNVISALYLYLGDWIEWDNFLAMMQQISTLYVTYMGLIIVFYFSKSDSTKSAKEKIGTPLVVALAGSILWNIIICIFVVRLVLEKGTVEDSVKQIGILGPLLSWLVAPAIAFYFANSSSQSGPETKDTTN
jgi:hypothetical protein